MQLSDIIFNSIIEMFNNNHLSKKNIVNTLLDSKEKLVYYKKKNIDKFGDSEIFNIKYDNITYDKVLNPVGSVNLELMYAFADVKTDKWVVGVHGYSSCKESIYFTMNQYRLKGYNVLCFDLRNHGNSDQEYITMGLNEKTDLIAILNYLIKKFSPKEIGLIGFSMGAFTINYFNITENSDDFKINWMISDSTYYDYKEILGQLLSMMVIPKTMGEFKLDLLVEKIAENYKKRFGFDMNELNIDKKIVHCKKTKPTLFFCSDNDIITPARDSYKFVEMRKKMNPKDEIINLKSTNHVTGCFEKTNKYYEFIDMFLKNKDK